MRKGFFRAVGLAFSWSRFECSPPLFNGVDSTHSYNTTRKHLGITMRHFLLLLLHISREQLLLSFINQSNIFFLTTYEIPQAYDCQSRLFTMQKWHRLPAVRKDLHLRNYRFGGVFSSQIVLVVSPEEKL